MIKSEETYLRSLMEKEALKAMQMFGIQMAKLPAEPTENELEQLSRQTGRLEILSEILLEFGILPKKA